MESICGFTVSDEERSYLVEPAKKYMEYASLPVMKEREKLWYAHNALHAERPPVVMELNTFKNDMLPPFRCRGPEAQAMESYFQNAIVNHELIDDDKVISPYYTVSHCIGVRQFDLNIKIEHAADSSGRSLGYKWEHPIHDLKEDFHLLRPSVYWVDRERTQALKTFAEEILGDIMPVRVKNTSLHWFINPTARVVSLMGMEKMMYSMVDYPEEMHTLMDFIRDDMLAYAKWQEREGLLTLNNGNDYMGSGSYCFTNELPRKDWKPGDPVTCKDIWMHANSQESVGISPDMFGEFFFPCYEALTREFGLLYYGCCEPVHEVWGPYISKLANLRKVSVSPWCDEEYMGEALRGSSVIYSRKPSPNFIGVGTEFDAEGFEKYIAKTLKAARGCHLEFIFRDIYTVSGDRTKPRRAVKIVREQIERNWNKA